MPDFVRRDIEGRIINEILDGDIPNVNLGQPPSELPYLQQTADQARENWRRRILDDLGGEGVDVDLTPKQLDAALERAMECWNKYRPYLAWFPFDVPAGETTIIDFFKDPRQTEPDKHPYTYVRNIVTVEFTDRNRRILGPRAGFLEGYYLRWGYQGPRLFYQLHTAERLYERMTGSRPDWKWDPATRRLMLSNPSRDLRAMVLASRERKLEELSYDNTTDFRRLAVASAKRTLARVEGARPTIPGASGNIETDAKELRSEAKEEWDVIEHKLEHSLAAVPPMEYIG
jgi:hypothetical protein